MSHHFDTPTAKEDPRINVNDFYLFPGAPGTTVMAMTVNPDAGLSAPDTFRDEGLYAFRFDLNSDAQEEVTFKFRFGEVAHGPDHAHVQNFTVRRATGLDAISSAEGDPLIKGETGKIVEQGGIRAFAGLAPELFAGDAVALRGYLGAFYKDKKFYPGAFSNRQNFFARRNVTAIVLEVPNELMGQGKVGAWATASLHGHAPEMQVSRWGLPLVTHLFFNDPALPDLKEQFNRATPRDDRNLVFDPIARFVEAMSSCAGTASDSAAYGRAVAERLCPVVLPYELGTPASFTREKFNGRPLTDDVMDVMLTLSANTELHDGVAPDPTRTHADFPYFGAPYTRTEQEGVMPAAKPKS